MGEFAARAGDAIVMIVFVALAAVLVRPGSQTGNIVGAGGNAFGTALRTATLR